MKHHRNTPSIICFTEKRTCQPLLFLDLLQDERTALLETKIYLDSWEVFSTRLGYTYRVLCHVIW